MAMNNQKTSFEKYDYFSRINEKFYKTEYWFRKIKLFGLDLFLCCENMQKKHDDFDHNVEIGKMIEKYSHKDYNNVEIVVELVEKLKNDFCEGAISCSSVYAAFERFIDYVQNIFRFGFSFSMLNKEE